MDKGMLLQKGEENNPTTSYRSPSVFQMSLGVHVPFLLTPKFVTTKQKLPLSNLQTNLPCFFVDTACKASILAIDGAVVTVTSYLGLASYA
jgi:hypothetical protein